MEQSPFTKTFFKLLGGLLVIIALGVVTAFGAGLYGASGQPATPIEEVR